jgi:hypothetical protein
VGLQHQEKLNWLQRSLPEGLIVDSSWLEKHGYSRSLRHKYVAHGWLDQVARRVYRRPVPKSPTDGGHEDLRWQPVVISLQTLLGYPFTVGGRTALELQGFGHYLTSREHLREIHLYGTGNPPGMGLQAGDAESVRFSQRGEALQERSRAWDPEENRNRKRHGKRSSEEQLYTPALGTMGMAADHVFTGAGDPRIARRGSGA